MTSLLLATRNTCKTREFAELLGDEFQITDLSSLTTFPKIEETGRTFEENATIKAIAVSDIFPNELVVADDSGLEVGSLDGTPGVLSARYAGEDASDNDNIAKLLKNLESVRDRRARFICFIALCRSGRIIESVHGEVSGTITEARRGVNGFGYDPVFVPLGYAETFGELPSTVKNAISHRAQAAKKLRALFLSEEHYRFVGGAARI